MPGSTPPTLVVAPAKPGHVYFLNAANFGGLGGQLRDVTVASTTAESVYTAPTAYTTGLGVHVAISTTIGSVCPGGVSNSNVMSILITPGAPPTTQIAWCAHVGDDDEIRRRSPISTTTDGQSNAVVWFMNGTKLNAFDGDTGALLFNGGTADCGESTATLRRLPPTAVSSSAETVICARGRFISSKAGGLIREL